MNALFVAAVVCSLGLANAVPSGILGGTILAAPSATAVVAGPAGIVGPGAIGLGGLGLGLGGIGLGGIGLGGAGVITNGGGAIGVSGLGAAVRGPPTAPAVISGPSGTVAANGLWGPTSAGLLGAAGAGVLGHGW